MNELLVKIGEENVDVILKMRSMMFEPMLRDLAILAVHKLRLKAFNYINNEINQNKKEMYVLSIEFPSIIDLIYNMSDEQWGNKTIASKIEEDISKYGVSLDDLFEKKLFDELLVDFK